MNPLLLETVQRFQENDLELTDAPKELVKQYGWPGLACALMWKKPEIPKYDRKNITRYIRTHKFTSLSQLISYARSLDNDVDKLFAIWCWEVYNIDYDVKSFFSGNCNHLDTSPEGVFASKKSVCQGYGEFFVGVANRVRLSRHVKVRLYGNAAKGYGYDEDHPPSSPDENHMSVFITINGDRYISEPTWGAGVVGTGRDCKFERNVNPKLFLIPLYSSMNNHYPSKTCGWYFPFPIEWKHYIWCVNAPIRLKTESHPFRCIHLNTDFLEQQFSWEGKLDSITVILEVPNGKGWKKIESGPMVSWKITDVIIKGNRRIWRIKTYTVFPSTGTYKLSVWIGEGLIEYKIVVNNASRETFVKSIVKLPPLIERKWMNEFVPMSQLSTIWKAGVAHLRWAMSTSRKKVLVSLKQLDNQYKEVRDLDDSIAKHSQFIIPFDDTMYENWVTITFPTDGLYKVGIWAENCNTNTFTYITNYFVTVSGTVADREVQWPANWAFKGRMFSPLEMSEHATGISVVPNATTVIKAPPYADCAFEITGATGDVVCCIDHVKGDRNATATETVLENGTRRYTWNPTRTGMWDVKVWIGGKYMFTQKWYMKKKESSEEPELWINRMNKLKEEIEHIRRLDETFVKSKGICIDDEDNKDDDNDIDVPVTTKSECCLLL